MRGLVPSHRARSAWGTAKFRRIMTMMIFGYAIFAVTNFIFAVFWSDSPFGL